MKKKFKLGDRVIWESQGNAKSKVKVGRVVGIIPPGKHPKNDALIKCKFWKKSQSMNGFTKTSSRKEVSYLVEVNSQDSLTSRPKVYWPRTNNLQSCNEEYEMLYGYICDEIAG